MTQAETNRHNQQVGSLLDGWTPRSRPGPVRLEGAYVVVEPLAPAHAPALHRALCSDEDDALWTYRSQERPTSAEEMAALVQEHLDSAEQVTFTLVPRDSGAAGIASYARVDTSTGQVEVAGVLFGRSLQRSTAATEAIHLLMRHAFDDLGYRRFEWKCDHLNEPSRRAALRLGFTYEGRFRNHMITKGRSRDTDWFSVTEVEWPDVRAEHERWLDPANFDADGRQRSPLRVAG